VQIGQGTFAARTGVKGVIAAGSTTGDIHCQLGDAGATWQWINAANSLGVMILSNAGNLEVTGTLSATGTLSGGTSGTGYSFSGSAAAGSLTLAANANLTLNNGECFTLGGKSYSVGTSATSISATHSYGSTAMIRGDGGSGILFADLVFFSDSVVTVLASQIVSSTPAARTYSAAGGILKLAMASGTYTVSVGITTLV
jgi:hypothetical protein